MVRWRRASRGDADVRRSMARRGGPGHRPRRPEAVPDRDHRRHADRHRTGVGRRHRGGGRERPSPPRDHPALDPDRSPRPARRPGGQGRRAPRRCGVPSSTRSPTGWPTSSSSAGSPGTSSRPSPATWCSCPSPILGATSLVSYQRAKAESLGISARGGLMERAERMILLGVGFLSTVFLVPVLWIMLGADHGHRGRTVRQGVAPRRGAARRPTHRRHRRIRTARAGSGSRATSPSRWRARRQGELASRSGRTWRARHARQGTPSTRRPPPHLTDLAAARRWCDGREQGRVSSSGPTRPSAAASPRCPSRSRSASPTWSGTSSSRVRHDHREMVSANLRRVARCRRRRSRRSSTDGHAVRFGPTLATGWKGPGSRRTPPERSGAADASSRASTTWWRGSRSGKGVIMALPHVGSWEYGGAFLASRRDCR